MEAGDKITFNFGKGKKEGLICKVSGKTVWIKTDFEKHKGKTIKRKRSQLEKAT